MSTHPRYRRPRTAVFLLASLLLALLPVQARALEARAMLIPAQRTVLSSEIAARIQEINVDFGDRFKKGAPLVRFDCATYAAELHKAEAELDEAEKIFQTNTRLAKMHSISALELAVSGARRQRAEAEVALRRAVMDKCTINAPFAGRLAARKAQPSQYVTPGQPLLEIIDHQHLFVQLFVPSAELKNIKPGTALDLKIDETGRDYPATVTVIGPEIDQVSQSIEIRAAISGNFPELLAGMSGTAIIKTQ